MGLVKISVSKKVFIRIFYSFFLIIIFLFTINFLVIGSGGFRVEPARFIIEMEAGSRVTEVITISNTSSRRLDLYANYYDWELNSDYELVTFEQGSIPESLEGLLRFNPRSFSLEPGEKQMVRFTVSFPEEEIERFERRGIIFFEHEDEFADQGVGASVTSMVGATVYAIPQGAGFTFYLQEGIVFRADDAYRAAVLMFNDGSRHVRFNIDYKIINANGQMVEEGRSEERIVLPKESRGIDFHLTEDLSPGQYELLLTFQLVGFQESLSEIIPFSIK